MASSSGIRPIRARARLQLCNYEVLIGHAAATWALVGLIWIVHFVHYPMLARAGAGFRGMHTFHLDRMGFVVGPLMLAELATALLLWASPHLAYARAVIANDSIDEIKVG